MKLMSLGAVLVSLSLVSCQTRRQTLPPELARQVDGIFGKWDRADSPGCALGIYKDGQIIYGRGYGIADLNDDVPITPTTVFHVASMSKQFTAASILLLAQRGKLSLDDDVHKYIPELPDFGKVITLRHLLHHTSGLRDQWSLLELAGWRMSQDLITDDDVMSVVVRQRTLDFTPGERYMYSNTGFTLLGIIVQRVSGMSLREFTTKNIFEPLGMTQTHFRDDHEEIIKHDALGYEQDGEDKPFRMNLTNFDTVGATSLHTTVEDLQRWDENFYHPRIGGSEFIRQMLGRGKLNGGEELDYASGLVISSYEGLPTVEHGGADAGYRSDLIRFPEQHFSTAVLCNLANTDPTALARQVADILLARELKPPAYARDSAKASGAVMTGEQMATMAGVYWGREEDEFLTLRLKNGKLQINMGRGDFQDLKSFAPAHFHVANVSWGDNVDIHLVTADTAGTRHVEEAFVGEWPKMYEPVAAFDITAAELTEYPGEFVSQETEPVYRISLQAGELTLLRLKHKPDMLRPVMRDVFVGEIGTVRFTRDAHCRVSGFILDAGRIQNFKFAKKCGT